MKFLNRTKTPSAVPRAARWLAAGLLIGICALPAQSFAQTCGGNVDITNDGIDLNINTVPDYLLGDLPEAIAWELTPKSGTANDIVVDQLQFALSCFNNGDLVPCASGNDGQAGNGALTPLQYVSLTGGTCGATFNNVTNGIVTFDLPDATLDTDGCTIDFVTELQDLGNDGTPEFVTPAVFFTGDCLGGALQGTARGSAIVEILDPAIDVTKTGPTNAKVGDTVTYTIGFTATSDPEVLGTCTGTDTVLGDLGIFEDGVTRNFDHVVQPGDPDPLLNTATIECEVVGSASTVSDFDDHSLDIIDPQIDVTKTGPDSAKVGDTITYTIGFTSASDGGLLGACTGSDTVLGDLGAFTDGETRNFDHVVQPGDPDPLLNVATITCLVEGFDNEASDSAEHSVDLIDPAIEVTKTGPDSAKVGDTITYTIGFTDTGTGTLGECTGSDTLLGNLGVFADGVTRNFNYVVQPGDPDPLPNTATITCDVEGFDNKASDSADHSVDLIDPEIETSKTGPDTAKVGDTISYTIGFTNIGTGTVENCTGTDTLLGDLGAFEDGVTRNFNYVVEPGDPNPLPNVATITCDVEGFDNQASDSAEHSVDLIDPAIDVTKTGPAIAKVGDTITYTIGFTDEGTGTLGECTGSDTVLGNLGVFEDGVLRDFSYTVQPDDPDPLLNVATITCLVEGFDNQASDSAEHSVDLIDPSVTLAKECRPDPVLPGEDINWAITVTNTGDIDLDCVVNDPKAGFVDEPVAVAAGDSEVLNASRVVEEGDAPSISNTATVVCPIPNFDNQLDGEATADCEVEVATPLCRTPGFWMNRAGKERGGRNITGEVIASATPPGLAVCGQFVDEPIDALEAMCVSIEGEIKRQLVRQLTAGMLNCRLGICPSDTTDLLARCNTACETEDSGQYNACIDEIDCFNNGGIWDGAMCIYGTGECSITGADCSDVEPCPMAGDLVQECLPDPTCHDEGNLCEEGAEFCFEPPGKTSSTRACKKAQKNNTYFPYPSG